MQRDPVGALEDGADDLPGCGQPGPGDQRDDERRLLARQRVQSELLREPLAAETGAPLAVERARRQLVLAVGGDEQQRPVASEAGEFADHLEAELVGPLEVVELEHGRPVDGVEDHAGHAPHEQPPALRGCRRPRSARRPAARRPACRTCRTVCIVRARSSTEASGTCRSWGARSPPASRNPAAVALRMIAPMSRLFPIPATPAIRIALPRPAAASARCRSASSRCWSRPTMSGLRRTRGAMVATIRAGALGCIGRTADGDPAFVDAARGR